MMTGMIVAAFNAVVYEPLYNALVFLIDVVPYSDVGISVILLTILVKLILFPLSLKATRTQITLRTMEPEIKELKERHKGDQQAQAAEMLKLYRKYNINPLSSIFLILIQLPIIFGLYWVFYKGGLPTLSEMHLYSFIPRPESINMEFLGLIDVAASKNILLALLAGISQYAQVKFALPALSPRKENATLQEDFTRSMHLNMRYIFPVMAAIFAYILSAAVALYWITSNLFAIGQELYVRKRIKRTSGELTPSAGAATAK